MDPENTSASVDRILGVLRRRALLISLCCLLAAVAAYGFSRTQTVKYTATASVVFNSGQQSGLITGFPTASSNDQQTEQNTNVQLMQLPSLAEKTAAALGRGLTKAAVKADVSISGRSESNIVEVSATATSPEMAAKIANTYATQFVTEQHNVSKEYFSSALAAIDKQLLHGASPALRERAASLQLLAELPPTNVQVAQAASLPTSPSSPDKSRNTLLGAFLGLLLGLGLAFLIERFDRRIREPGDLEEIYRVPLLGVVSESPALSPSTPYMGQAWGALPPAETEVFNLIRAHLRSFNGDRQPHSVVIASAAPNDGKTTIAGQLAAAAAGMGSRVLLLEADLRRPTLARRLGIRPTPGLSELVMDTVSMDEATQSIDLQVPPSDAATQRTLDVLVAGHPLPPNPPELIASGAMDAVLELAKSAYDLVVIDTPPLDAVSDAFPLLRKVDGVIVVAWVGRTPRGISERLHQTLNTSDASLLGVIANGVKPGAAGLYGTDAYVTRERSPASVASVRRWTVRDEGISHSREAS